MNCNEEKDLNKPASQFYECATICMFQLHHPFRVTNVNVSLLFVKLIHTKIASKIFDTMNTFPLQCFKLMLTNRMLFHAAILFLTAREMKLLCVCRGG